MTEELPKNQGFLKFIVIFMGILIVIGLAVIIWKVIDLAKKKAAREKMEAAQQEKMLSQIPSSLMPAAPFAFDFTLESGEQILEISAAPGGLWVRLGKQGMTSRIILVDFTGKVIGEVKVKQSHEIADPAQ